MTRHQLCYASPTVVRETAPSRGQSEWVVPLCDGTLRPSRGAQNAWHRIRERAGTTDARIHDLRRIAGSWLAASGYGLPMIGRVLNHSQPSVKCCLPRLDLEPVRRALEANAQAMLGQSRIARNMPGVIDESG
jgi:hypothetical protein